MHICDWTSSSLKLVVDTFKVFPKIKHHSLWSWFYFGMSLPWMVVNVIKLSVMNSDSNLTPIHYDVWSKGK